VEKTTKTCSPIRGNRISNAANKCQEINFRSSLMNAQTEIAHTPRYPAGF